MSIGQIQDYRRLFGMVLVCVALGVAGGCKSKPKAPPTVEQLVGVAHGLDNWRYQRALRGLLFVKMESQPQVEADFYYEVDSGKVRLELPDKTVVVYDGKQTWVAPESSPLRDARGTYVAWAKLIAVPFRLKEAGAQVTALPVEKLGATEYVPVQVKFATENVFGPDDWYVAYADPQSHRLLGLAYGKTGGGVLDEPRAITFYDFKRVEGSQISTEWKFWRYHKAEGLYGLPLGGARLLNLEFVVPKKNTFVKPVGARADQ
ncbi:MAG: hypothetical protein ACM359_23185 [Bacillota bacterium]